MQTEQTQHCCSALGNVQLYVQVNPYCYTITYAHMPVRHSFLYYLCVAGH